MFNRPRHIVAIVYHLVAGFFPVVARLRTCTPRSTLTQLKDILAELLSLAARLNSNELRKAAFARRREFQPLPSLPPIPREWTARTPPGPRAPRTTLTSHQMVTRMAALLEQLEALIHQLGPLIPANLQDLCAEARAETARRLHPIRYVVKPGQTSPPHPRSRRMPPP